MEVPPVNSVYQCPGESYSISREIHLGRLLTFYAKCVQCPHRLDTATMSRRLVDKLRRSQRPAAREPQFVGEGRNGLQLNEITPAQVREFAAAFGLSCQPADAAVSNTMLLAGDGRPHTLELVAVAGEGLRWSGCDVIELGIASAPCLASAVSHLAAAGGLLVGNPTNHDHMVGVKLWGANGRPITSNELDEIRRLIRNGLDRPHRSSGRLERFHGELPYLTTFQSYFHALRPLRFVVDTPCRPLVGYLRRLMSNVACEATYQHSSGEDRSALAARIRREQAHFGIIIDGNAECCRLFDDKGQPVASHALFTLVTLELLATQPGSTVVLEDGTPEVANDCLATAGARVAVTPTPAKGMYAALLTERAAVGGGAGEFVWFGGAAPAPDALLVLSHLLRRLSRNDRPVSEAITAASDSAQHNSPVPALARLPLP